MNGYKQAISFANSYFALADGLASGLENHLSEDVVLDWFGRIIKGRKNVSAFMETHKVNSRHIFPHIVPTTGIGYKEKHLNRKKFRSYYHRDQEECREKYSNSDNDNDEAGVESFHREVEISSTRNVITDINQNEIDAKEVGVMDDTSYDLNEGDLSNLFKLEITSTNIEEIEQSINRIKLEEEMAPTIKAIKRECSQGDGSVDVESSAIKYVEADGEIEFSRKFWKRDAWNAYFLATSNFHTWRRQCNLQIAYTTLIERPTLKPLCKSKSITVEFEQPKVKLPTLEEINEISNRLVPNTNGFGGFLKELDFFEDRKGFLESLETEMATKDCCTPLFVPQYMENKLIFDKPCVNLDECNSKHKKKFVFNYQIHLIIYESNNKCKMNLLHEFEKTKA